MSQGAIIPNRGPPVRTQVVHASRRTRITRLFFPERTLICKEPLGPDAQRRLRREVEMLQRLRGVDGVAHLVPAPPDAGSIVLEDAGASSLRESAKLLASDELIELAVCLAQAVSGMHRRGVMHGDITPANIVVSGEGAPCLVDFALATSLAEIRPDFTHHTEIVGTPAYPTRAMTRSTRTSASACRSTGAPTTTRPPCCRRSTCGPCGC
jgi:serine/threonine protein kinase